MKKKYLFEQQASAKIENILRWFDYRVTLLSDNLFRIEKSHDGIFEDRATQAVLHRNMPIVSFTFIESDESIKIQTKEITLLLKKDFGSSVITVEGKEYFLSESVNLLGTYRTLDGFEGNRCMCEASSNHEGDIVELNNGVCAQNGFAIIDDNSFVVSKNGEFIARRKDNFDKYIFAYGKDYRAALKAFYDIEGYTPLIPRFALGNWWSRYYPYSERTYLKLLNKFKENHIPLSVAVIDMDWHYSVNVDEEKGITASGRNSEFFGGNNGWTGFSWNTNLFPSPKDFVEEVKGRGLKVSLNLHPADGIRWWEDMYEDFAKRVGVDPKTYQHIPFDITDEEFAESYLRLILHPNEEIGVDFWWIDWQQGNKCKIENLDPLWMLNHYHYVDQKNRKEEPLILSRYCGDGAHRYPLGFSGDTYISWKTLEYLPYFTANATNIGYTWWSHDIGGHFEGIYDNELFVRFLQFGCFSPINRLHSCDNPVLSKEPWYYLNGTGDIAIRYLRLRHALVPLLYTAAYKTATEGRALIEPMYYGYPLDKEAYEHVNQYLFAEQMIVAPITSPAEGDFAVGRVWLPKGKWTDFFTGEQYDGGRVINVRRTLDYIPVFVKEGGIIPLAEDIDINGCPLPQELAVRVYEGDGEYVLYEDEMDKKLFTEFKSKKTKDGQQLTFIIKGEKSVMPINRKMKFVFANVDSGDIECYKDGQRCDINEIYADNCTFELSSIGCGVEYTLYLKYTPKTKEERVKEYISNILMSVPGCNTTKWDIYKELKEKDSIEEIESFIRGEKRISDEVKERILETF